MENEMLQDEIEVGEIERDQFIVFTIEAQQYGLPVTQVLEISTVLPTTQVPNAPAYIDGIMNLRGRLASVIDFRKKLRFEAREHDEDTRVIILEHEGFPVGLVVDSVEEVIKIPDAKVQTMPEATAASVSEEYVTGVGMLEEQLIILLDVENVLTEKEWTEAVSVTQASDGAAEASNGTNEAETDGSPPAVSSATVAKGKQRKKQQVEGSESKSASPPSPSKKRKVRSQSKQAGAESKPGRSKKRANRKQDKQEV